LNLKGRDGEGRLLAEPSIQSAGKEGDKVEHLLEEENLKKKRRV